MKTWAGGTTDEAGALNILLVPFILITLFFFSAAGFAYWAYNSKLDYQASANAVAKQAVDASKAQLSAQREAEFATKLAYPFNTYTSPAAEGSVTVKYPKSWSAYVHEQVGASVAIDGYFYPNFVPSVEGLSNNYAVRLQVIEQSQDNLIKQYQAYVLEGSVVQQTYRSPNIPDAIGYRLDGKLQNQKQGHLIMLPLREKTVLLWTESAQFYPDFTNVILPNFTFKT